MTTCRINTCTRAACQRPTARGFCVPCAWGWYFSREARESKPPESYAQRREGLDMLRGHTSAAPE